MKLLYEIGVGSLVQLFKYGLFFILNVLVNFNIQFHFSYLLNFLFWMQSVVDEASG